ncbi:hypothetical protein GIW78_18050 [Pseudomonas syringae]|nr:hypothetical protein [Pseudomonas syringae]
MGMMSVTSDAHQEGSRSGVHATFSLQLQQRGLQGLQVGTGARYLTLNRHGFLGLFFRRAFAALCGSQLRFLLGELFLSVLDLLLYLLDGLIERRLAGATHAAAATRRTGLATFGGCLIRAFLCFGSRGGGSSSGLGCFSIGRFNR